MLIIPLNHGLIAKVDDEDFDRVMRFSWVAEQRPNTWYASSSLGRGKYAQRIRLHRFVLNLVGPLPHVDHENRNGLDCQKHNLRTATIRQNSCNYTRPVGATGYRGVALKGGRFYAKIRTPEGVRRSIGGYKTAEEAAMHYDEAAIMYHGEFATLNFPDRWSTLAKVKDLDSYEVKL